MQAKFALPHCHISQANSPRTSGTVTPLPSLHTKNVVIPPVRLHVVLS